MKRFSVTLQISGIADDLRQTAISEIVDELDHYYSHFKPFVVLNQASGTIQLTVESHGVIGGRVAKYCTEEVLKIFVGAVSVDYGDINIHVVSWTCLQG